MDYDELKHKLRKLKRLEIDKLFNGKEQPRFFLIWDSFFDLHDVSISKAKYTLTKLASMNHEEYKNVINEYLSFLYNEIYKETCTQDRNYDPKALIKMNLPYNANEREIKRRFHELAKIYHPDTGGDDDEFIKLMVEYKNLIKNNI